MNIDVSRNNWIIVFVLLAVVILGGIGFATYQTYVGFKSSQVELAKVKKQRDDLLKIAEKKTFYESQIKFTKSEFLRYSTSLPKDILQENTVETMRDYAQKSGMELLDIGLNPVEITDSGLKMTVRLSFAGDYAKIADFLGMINSNTQKTVVPQMALTGKGKKLTGSATIVMYGYKDSAVAQTPWDSKIAQGKSDLFKLYDGAPIDEGDESDIGTIPTATDLMRQSTSPYDLFVVSGPITDDAPTTVVGKNNVAGSEVFADGDKVNWVNVYLTEENGKVFYRYRTEFASYPEGNASEEFVPVISGKIILKVTAKPKMNGKDNAGTEIRVINKTKREAVVKINQQAGVPRVSVTPQRGLVKTMYE